MIKIENLAFAYPSSYENVFEDVNLALDTTWKLGFVDRNGRLFCDERINMFFTQK